MLVTKHAAELCALAVSDVLGELPSRIVHALIVKGRSTVVHLCHHTSLSATHIRTGLAVLIQQNLLYHCTESDANTTYYEANAYACYNLIRSGKVLEVLEARYGHEERELVQTLQLLGHARISDLARAYGSKLSTQNGSTNGSHEPRHNSFGSTPQLNQALVRLVQARIIETMHPSACRNPKELYHEIDLDITKKTKLLVRSAKAVSDQNSVVAARFREIQSQSQSLKQRLDQLGPQLPKKRKLENGTAYEADTAHEEALLLDPDIILRVNHERCLVELRNQRLANFARDVFGDVTAEIYRTLLDLLTSQLPRCRRDAVLDGSEHYKQPVATSLEINNHLDKAIHLSSGIGKVPSEKIDRRSAEKVRTRPRSGTSNSEDFEPDMPASPAGGAAPDSDSDGSDGSSDEPSNMAQQVHESRESKRGSKVQFEEAPQKDDSFTQLRRHLLMLAESQHGFVRLCGTAGRGQWTVDFEPLLSQLRETELDAYIEQSYGRHGLRLTRILRQKGKLDEKMLPSAALMKKSDVQEKMLAMQMGGLVEVQEVPKDNSRVANRTLFFWFFDADRVQSQLLDDLYKAMLRGFQTLQAERYKNRNILSFVDRKDVKGKEEEIMSTEHYNKYNDHLVVQERLLGQIMRLDGMVAAFRDF